MSTAHKVVCAASVVQTESAKCGFGMRCVRNTRRAAQFSSFVCVAAWKVMTKRNGKFVGGYIKSDLAAYLRSRAALERLTVTDILNDVIQKDRQRWLLAKLGQTKYAQFKKAQTGD